MVRVQWGSVSRRGSAVLTAAPGLDGKQSPGTGDALELVVTAVGELDSRPGDQVDHGARDQYLARVGQAGHPSTDMDGDAAEVVVSDLTLAGVQPGANLQAQPSGAVPYGTGAPDCPGGTVERGEDPVAGVLDRPPPEPLQLSADHGVVIVEQPSPAAVAEVCARLAESTMSVKTMRTGERSAS